MENKKYCSATDAMKLPKKERDILLEESALLAEKIYSENPELYDFVKEIILKALSGDGE